MLTNPLKLSLSPCAPYTVSTVAETQHNHSPISEGLLLTDNLGMGVKVFLNTLLSMLHRPFALM